MTKKPDTMLEVALVNAERIAARLQKSLAECGRFFPLTSDSMSKLNDDQERAIDAFLKRWEQLQDTMSNRVLRALLAAIGDDITAFTAQSAFDRSAAIGAIADAKAFFERHLLRNRLAHEYPEGETRRALQINEAFNVSPALLADLILIRRCADASISKET